LDPKIPVEGNQFFRYCSESWAKSGYVEVPVASMVNPVDDLPGPVIGGFVQENKGFRWLEWVCVFLAVLTYILALGMRETYKKIILERLARSEKVAQAGMSRPRFDTTAIVAGIKHWVSTSMGRPVVMLATEPVVFFLSLYVALNFGILYNFFPAIPWSLAQTYNFNQGQAGLAFLAIAIGCIVAMITALTLDVRLQRKYKNLDKSPASKYLEQILWPAMLGSFGGPTALFWFAWSTRRDVSWASPICALIPFAWGNLCIFVGFA
jgi:hypothetical protein